MSRFGWVLSWVGKAAESVLLNQGRAATDLLVAAKITDECRLSTDDGRIAAGVRDLNAQASAIPQVVTDVGIAGQIVGYIAKAAIPLGTI